MSTSKRVLVVGPHTESTGGIVTFQRNLMRISNLNETWELYPIIFPDRPKSRSQSQL